MAEPEPLLLAYIVYKQTRQKLCQKIFLRKLGAQIISVFLRVFFTMIQIGYKCNFVLSEVCCRRPVIPTFQPLSALKVTQIDLRASSLRTAGSAIFASNIFSQKDGWVFSYSNIVFEYLSMKFFILERGWYELRYSLFCIISHTSLQFVRSKTTAQKYSESFKH